MRTPCAIYLKIQATQEARVAPLQGLPTMLADLGPVAQLGFLGCTLRVPPLGFKDWSRNVWQDIASSGDVGYLGTYKWTYKWVTMVVFMVRAI